MRNTEASEAGLAKFKAQIEAGGQSTDYRMVREIALAEFFGSLARLVGKCETLVDELIRQEKNHA